MAFFLWEVRAGRAKKDIIYTVQVFVSNRPTALLVRGRVQDASAALFFHAWLHSQVPASSGWDRITGGIGVLSRVATVSAWPY